MLWIFPRVAPPERDQRKKLGQQTEAEAFSRVIEAGLSSLNKHHDCQCPGFVWGMSRPCPSVVLTLSLALSRGCPGLVPALS